MTLHIKRSSSAAIFAGLSVLLIAAVYLMAGPTSDESSVSNATPPELGKIAWIRGFDTAAKRAQVEKRPLLVLFQEVPGCSTCKNYGSQVLSHPLILDAVETLFIPAVVYNNVKGDDERTLKSFKESSWNNPVVRIITPDRKPLTQRLAGDYTVGGLASAMVEALEKDRREVPVYLRLLAGETSSRKRGVQKATFAMHCFWAGEVSLGDLPGVISTTPGFLKKKEIVEVEFDPNEISYATLVQEAKKFQCANNVFARNDAQHKEARKLVGSSAVRTDDAIRPDKKPKYYLSKTAYKYVPMTGLQAARVNAAIFQKKDPNQFLSPRQIELLRFVRKHSSTKWPDAIGAENLPRAWQLAENAKRSAARS